EAHQVNGAEITHHSLADVVNVIGFEQVVVWHLAHQAGRNEQADPTAVEIGDIVVRHDIVVRGADPDARPDPRRKNSAAAADSRVLDDVILGDVLFRILPLLPAADANSADAKI